MIEPWPVRESARFWARIFLLPRREYPRGPHIPIHPTDAKLAQHLIEVGEMLHVANGL